MTQPTWISAAIQRHEWQRQINAEWCAVRHEPKKRWDVLRRAYQVMLPEILQRRSSPYFLDWTPSFTPIEMWAWMDIRAAGLPLYPQVPALHYFLDFADPVLQIAVELDGANFHSPERDRPRDEALWEQGWRVFRIPGKRSLPTMFDIRDELHSCTDMDSRGCVLMKWGCTYSEGFFWALGVFYYGRKSLAIQMPDGVAKHIAARILAFHRLVDFPLADTIAVPDWVPCGDAAGTSAQGRAEHTYADIVDTFGEPDNTDFSEGARTCFEWIITFADGTVATIYDFKASNLYGDDPKAPTPQQMKQTFCDWHIGGKSQRAVQLVLALLDGDDD